MQTVKDYLWQAGRDAAEALASQAGPYMEAVVRQAIDAAWSYWRDPDDDRLLALYRMEPDAVSERRFDVTAAVQTAFYTTSMPLVPMCDAYARMQGHLAQLGSGDRLQEMYAKRLLAIEAFTIVQVEEAIVPWTPGKVRTWLEGLQTGRVGHFPFASGPASARLQAARTALNAKRRELLDGCTEGIVREAEAVEARLVTVRALEVRLRKALASLDAPVDDTMLAGTALGGLVGLLLAGPGGAIMAAGLAAQMLDKKPRDRLEATLPLLAEYLEAMAGAYHAALYLSLVVGLGAAAMLADLAVIERQFIDAGMREVGEDPAGLVAYREKVTISTAATGQSLLGQPAYVGGPTVGEALVRHHAALRRAGLGQGWSDAIDAILVMGAEAGEGPEPPPEEPRRGMTEREACELLGLVPPVTPATTSPEMVRKAYLRQMTLVHPDKVAHLHDVLVAVAHEYSIKLGQARDLILAKVGG